MKVGTVARLNSFLLLACLTVSVCAQVQALSPEQMVEQLKPPVFTRSLRNLNVESASVQSPRPSLTLLIQFDYDSSNVRPASQQDLSNLAQALNSRELMDSRFAIEGHTDGKGSLRYNQRLSELRANAVRDYLVRNGVAQERLLASGKGASELANRADPGAAENRRVRIVNMD